MGPMGLISLPVSLGCPSLASVAIAAPLGTLHGKFENFFVSIRTLQLHVTETQLELALAEKTICGFR